MRAKWHSILRARLRSRPVINVSTLTVCEAKEDLSYDLRRSLDEIATVFRCRDATVLKIILTQKFFFPLLSIRNSCDRNLVVICAFGYSNIFGGKNDDRF